MIPNLPWPSDNDWADQEII